MMPPLCQTCKHGNIVDDCCDWLVQAKMPGWVWDYLHEELADLGEENADEDGFRIERSFYFPELNQPNDCDAYKQKGTEQ